jgi:hypothetical protein
LKNSCNQRDAKWTESIAACPVKSVFSFNWGGDNEFMMETKAKLGAKAMGRQTV